MNRTYYYIFHEEAIFFSDLRLYKSKKEIHGYSESNKTHETG